MADTQLFLESFLIGIKDVCVWVYLFILDVVEAAYACPQEVGSAVYKARILYHKVWNGPHPLTYDVECNQLSLRESKQSPATDEYQVYPNPTRVSYTETMLYL